MSLYWFMSPIPDLIFHGFTTFGHFNADYLAAQAAAKPTTVTRLINVFPDNDQQLAQPY